jgi:polyphenol oxidase
VQKILLQNLPLWQFESFSSVKHFVSGRDGGISPSPFDSLNLSFSAGDEKENVIENRNRIAKSLGIQQDHLLFVSQCHSSDVVIVRTKEDAGGQILADALITNVSGLCICVMGADCVPVLVYDPIQKVIAAVHAGWKGTVASILTKTLSKMQSEFGSKMENIQIGIGPSISQEKYEVGEEVYLQFKDNFETDTDLIFKYDSNSNKYFPDLWLANKMQAMKMGVLEQNIEIAGICTFSNPEEFFSARYFKNKTGRFAAGIVL